MLMLNQTKWEPSKRQQKHFPIWYVLNQTIGESIIKIDSVAFKKFGLQKHTLILWLKFDPFSYTETFEIHFSIFISPFPMFCIILTLSNLSSEA